MALEAIPRAVALMGDRIILTLSNMRLLRLSSSSSTLRQEPPLAQYRIRPRPRLIPTQRMGTHSSSSSSSNNKVLW